MNSIKPAYSKNFEISFIITLIVIGILISIAIWSTGRNIDVNETEFNKFTNQIIDNQKEIKTELTALKTEINNKFSNTYNNQDKINQNISSYSNDIINKLDKINYKINNLNIKPNMPTPTEE